MSDDLMKYVRREDAVGFRSAVHDSLNSKVFDALELKKVEAATEYLDQDDLDEEEVVEGRAEIGDDHREAQRTAMHGANDAALKGGKINRTVHRTVHNNIKAGHHDSDNPNPNPRIGRHQHQIQQARRAARPPSLEK
jgi:hypothetical protein